MLRLRVTKKLRAPKLLFIMDPPATVLPTADTSFALMLQAQAQGMEIHHCLIQDLRLADRSVWAQARVAMLNEQQAPYVLLHEQKQTVEISSYTAVFMRKDPPFDANYLYATQLLEHARGKSLLINDPRGLRDANEKLYATHFPGLMPASLVSSDKADIKAFMKNEGGKIVIKPLSGAGGDSVFLLKTGDLNVNAIIETVTQNSTRVVMAQRFLPEVTRGDKRILLLAGKPLGAIWRVPKKDDVRSNIHVGGSVELATLDAADEKIIAGVAPRLKRDGLVFVGLDVIGGKLTEVNVTSPTGIQQMARLGSVNLAKRVIDWTLAHAVS